MDVIRTSVILLLLIVTGCQYDPYTAVFTTKQPNPNDLVGVYVADAKTLAFIAKEGNYGPVSPSIELKSDGTIIITGIPDWWLTSFGKPQGGLDSGRGKWTIKKHQEWWALGVSFKDLDQFASLRKKTGGFATDMMLIGEKPPYKIHLTMGDPDQGRAMQFERSSPEKKRKAP